MSHPSKRKGNAYEREVVEAARAFGLDARRAWGSNGEALGHCAEVDLVIGAVRVQAKRRARLPAYLQVPEGCDAVVVRQDRGESLVLVPLAHYLALLERKP